MNLRSITLALCALAGHALAMAAPALQAIPLPNGPTPVDFTGKGMKGLAMLAHRENFNAHSFEVLTLYFSVKDGSGSKAAEHLEILPVFDGNDEKLTLTAGGGADCMLHDFRLVRHSGRKAVELVVARREPGSSFADSAPVEFRHYALKTNEEADPGRPSYYFELASTQKSKRSYCDVGEAMAKELGLR